MSEFRVDPRIDEEIQQYIGEWHGLMIRSGLGGMLEAARDMTRPNDTPQDAWRNLGIYHDSRVLKLARYAAITMWGAQAIYRPAVGVLWAYCHPTTVTTCDGLYGNVGRLLALYPMTETGRRAKDEHGRSLVRFGMNNPGDALRQLNADRVQAKGDARELWSAIRGEAATMRRQSFDAYVAARRAVWAHDREFSMAPTRDELTAGLRQ